MQLQMVWGFPTGSLLGKAIDENMLNFTQMTALLGYMPNVYFPYVFVTNEGFAMKPNMLRPYSRKNEFNPSETTCTYRLSRARRVIENPIWHFGNNVQSIQASYYCKC